MPDMKATASIDLPNRVPVKIEAVASLGDWIDIMRTIQRSDSPTGAASRFTYLIGGIIAVAEKQVSQTVSMNEEGGMTTDEKSS